MAVVTADTVTSKNFYFLTIIAKLNANKGIAIAKHLIKTYLLAR